MYAVNASTIGCGAKAPHLAHTRDSVSRTIIGYYGSIMSQAHYLVCCINTQTCDKYVTRRDQPQVVRQDATTSGHNYNGNFFGINRGTRPDPEKVNLV